MEDDATLPAASRSDAGDVETRPSSSALVGQLLAAGTMVGRYEIVRRIGHGGMGVVYLAIDTELERDVALKLVRSSATMSLDELTERLRRESRLQARAKHPCVITVHDIGRDGDRVYVAMELARGGTLRAWLASAPGGWRAIVDVFQRAGEGLAAAHAAGLVHRDFKPDNVLVEKEGPRIVRVLVSDFGVARAVEAAEQSSTDDRASLLSTVPGGLVGTPAYMAPEQLRGAAVDARADVFAFGVGLWEALYGTRPYNGATIPELIAELDEPLPAPAHGDRAPRWLERVLRRTLEIDAAKRYASMDAVLQALDWRRRYRRMWIAFVAALAVAAVVAMLVLARTPAAVSPCDRDPENVAAVRSAAARLHLAAVGDHGRRRDLWVDALDRFARTSERLRADVCRAMPRPANREDRVRCIDWRTADVAAFAGALARLPPARADLAVQSPPPEPPRECGSDVAGAIVRDPGDVMRVAVADVRLDVAAASAIALLDRDASARELAQVLERARALGIPYVVDEVLLARAQVLRDEPSAKDNFREVGAAAQRDGAPVLAARAWLASARLGSSTDSKSMRDLLAQAGVALDLAGNPPSVRAYWHAYSAYAYATDSKLAEAAKDISAADALIASSEMTPDAELAGVLGDAELRGGNLTAALARYARVFEPLAKVTTMDEEVMTARVRYAGALILNKQIDQACDVLGPVLAPLDPAHRISSMSANAIQLLANAYLQLERYADVEQLVARWQPAVDRDLGPHKLQGAKLAYARARAALGLASLDEAERESARVLERYVEILGADNYDTAEVRLTHGYGLLRLRRFAAARDDLERGVKDLIAAADEGDPFVIQGRVWIAALRVHEGKPAEALALLEANLEPYRKLGPEAESMAAAELVLAQALAALHRDPARARALLEHGLSVLEAAPAPWAAEIADAKAALAALRR